MRGRSYEGGGGDLPYYYSDPDLIIYGTPGFPGNPGFPQNPGRIRESPGFPDSLPGFSRILYRDVAKLLNEFVS